MKTKNDEAVKRVQKKLEECKAEIEIKASDGWRKWN